MHGISLARDPNVQLFVASDDGDQRFHAAVAVLDPNQEDRDLLIIMEVKNCESTIHALEELYKVSRSMLILANAGSKSNGGDLGDWDSVRLQ